MNGGPRLGVGWEQHDREKTQDFWGRRERDIKPLPECLPELESYIWGPEANNLISPMLQEPIKAAINTDVAVLDLGP